jgi:hypothetical protein
MRQKIISTYRREGISSVVKKAHYRISYYLIRFFERSSFEETHWQEIKGKYKGKRVFLLGNGPSLNETPLYMLRDEYVICFNRFYIMRERLNWVPNFYMCVDDLVLQDLAPEVKEIIKDMELAFFPDRHFRNKNFKKILPNLPKMFWMKPIFGRGFSIDLPKVYQGGSVIYEGMQVMNYLGFDEVILLGVDMNFKMHRTAKTIGNVRGTNITSQDDDDPNHFDPRYFGKNRSYHQPKAHVLDNIVKNLDYLGENLGKYDVNITNAGFGSKVKSFPRKEFFSLFNKTSDEIKDIFDKLMMEKGGKNSAQFEAVYPFVKTKDELNLVDGLTSFYTTKDYGLKIVGNKVHAYLALGPFEEKYYFLLRSNKI